MPLWGPNRFWPGSGLVLRCLGPGFTVLTLGPGVRPIFIHSYRTSIAVTHTLIIQFNTMHRGPDRGMVLNLKYAPQGLNYASQGPNYAPRPKYKLKFQAAGDL